MQIQAIEKVSLTIEVGFPLNVSPTLSDTNIADLLPRLYALVDTHLLEVGV
ncbi:MAG: hypothetical protein H7240_01060, partial [Glaciimonas sp.]|nr:hypothetical protein [Glaciimonas sp.]